MKTCKQCRRFFRPYLCRYCKDQVESKLCRKCHYKLVHGMDIPDEGNGGERETKR